MTGEVEVGLIIGYLYDTVQAQSHNYKFCDFLPSKDLMFYIYAHHLDKPNVLQSLVSG